MHVEIRRLNNFIFFFTIIEKTCLLKQKYCLKKKKGKQFPFSIQPPRKAFFLYKRKEVPAKTFTRREGVIYVGAVFI